MSSVQRPALEQAASTAVGTSARRSAIVPLPEDVVAQLRSSPAIVSLPGVLLELLKNALDARACRVEATVDFARGGCAVEDNGLGIAPDDFRDGGGLGKLYCTSKYMSADDCLGRNGAFLASLGAMCLLTITSRHRDYRSHNLLTLHHASVIDRQLPASSQHEINGKHGTRVTVRNLFGNLPVRVKQRGIAAEHRAEHHRLWDLLKRHVTGLLLGWREPVSIRIHDADGKTCISLSNSSHSDGYTASRPSALQSRLNVLTQAGYVLHNEWSSWVPVSASTSTIRIKGAISLDPAPSKRVQFISLGATPLSSDNGHNELYDEIGRLFALSSFGVTEHDATVDQDEKIRRHGDNRFKSDGHTIRQLRARKGVDRYPMFYLSLSWAQDDKLFLATTLSDDNANLCSIVDVMKAMITQWLAFHHFRPRQALQKQLPPRTLLASSNDTEGDVTASSGRHNQPLGLLSQPRVASVLPTSTPIDLNSRKRKRPRGSLSRQHSDPSQSLAFTVWSRTKSSNTSFPDNLYSKKTVRISDLPASHIGSPAAPDCVKNDGPPVPAGALCPGSGSDSLVIDTCCEADEYHDEKILWTDPINKKTYFLNARTGSVLSHPPAKPQIDPLPRVRASVLEDMDKSLRLRPNSTTPSNESNAWLNGVLETWKNPVFMSADKKIPQATILNDEHVHGCTHINQWDTRRGYNEESFNALSTSSALKLSKEGLEKAEVLAQLDKKFILVKMKSFNDSVEGPKTDGEVLVLIDQHAADERLRVEVLLANLCAPLPTGTSSYYSKLGHESHVAVSTLDKPIHFTLSHQERQQFTAHAPKFAAWGILFDVAVSRSSETKLQPLLSVTALPPVIAERCKADPQVLVTFLRTAVWKYADAGHLPHPVDESDEREVASCNSAAWVRRISNCPEGLIDLVNSRACRSAIMFNDELSTTECRELVRRLCKCVFPFMCAHGRPSMVPLVDIGNASSLETTTEHTGKGTFSTAWKQWQTKQATSI